jgi:hypothetical protein
MLAIEKLSPRTALAGCSWPGWETVCGSSGGAGDEQAAADRLRDEPSHVRGDDDPLAVAAIGEHSADQREDQERDELRGHHQPDGAEAPSGLEDRERQRDEHHPVADERQHLAGEQQPELRLRAQHVGDERAQPAGRLRALLHGERAYVTSRRRAARR